MASSQQSRAQSLSASMRKTVASTAGGAHVQSAVQGVEEQQKETEYNGEMVEEVCYGVCGELVMVWSL